MYKGRILVVDDLPDVRATVSGLLEDAGYEVREASDRSEALVQINVGHFQVAVLDIRLVESDPDNRDGLLLMHEIRQNDPSMVIIIMTGYADVKMVREALEPDRYGVSLAFSFLEKTDLGQLPEYIQRAFGKARRAN